MIKNKKKFRLIIFLGLLLLSTISNVTVNADEKASPSSFGYKVIFPENQMEENVGYYHLKMEPGKEQTVQMQFTNPANKKTTIGVSVNSAVTNSNGVIEYGENSIKKDKSLKFNLKDIVSAPKKIELNPGETKNLELKIKMPETSFDGVIAGGIQLIQEGQDNVENKGGSMVLNEYAYVTAMLLQETDKKVTPKLALNSVKAGQANFKNMVYVNYSNTESTFVDNMTTEVQISEKGNSTVAFERKQAKMRMAPNTSISFPVTMNGEKMKAGDYTAKILVTADGGIREEWTKDFKITKEEADKFNERDVGLTQDKGINWKLIAIIVVVFFGLVLIIVLALMKIKKKKKNNQKKIGKKKKSGNRS